MEEVTLMIGKIIDADNLLRLIEKLEKEGYEVKLAVKEETSESSHAVYGDVRH